MGRSGFDVPAEATGAGRAAAWGISPRFDF